MKPTKTDVLNKSAKTDDEKIQFISSSLQDDDTITSCIGNDIVVELTPDGIIASDDTDALDRFESLLRQLIPPGTTLTDRQITVFTKYVKSDVAKSLIQKS